MPRVLPGMELLGCYTQDMGHSPDNTHQTQHTLTTS